jgi:hypothetical protein
VRSVIRSRRGRAAAALVLSILWPLAAHAQSPAFIAECKHWIDKKGYSTDYIEQKAGKRQPGLASAWRGNVAVQEVQPGDVVLVALRRPGAQHAAFVEEVRKGADGAARAVRVSEWNWGRTTDERCLITETFGRLAPPRWIDLAGVAQVWRPSTPLGN